MCLSISPPITALLSPSPLHLIVVAEASEEDGEYDADSERGDHVRVTEQGADSEVTAGGDGSDEDRVLGSRAVS